MQYRWADAGRISCPTKNRCRGKSPPRTLPYVKKTEWLSTHRVLWDKVPCIVTESSTTVLCEQYSSKAPETNAIYTALSHPAIISCEWTFCTSNFLDSRKNTAAPFIHSSCTLDTFTRIFSAGLSLFTSWLRLIDTRSQEFCQFTWDSKGSLPSCQ